MEVLDGTSHPCYELRLMQIQRTTSNLRQLQVKLKRTTFPQIDKKLTAFMERFVNVARQVRCDGFKMREGKENR